MPEHSRIAHLVGVELIELRSGQMDEAGLHEVGQQGRVVARQCAAAYIALELLVELRSEDGEDVDVLRHLDVWDDLVGVHVSPDQRVTDQVFPLYE